MAWIAVMLAGWQMAAPDTLSLTHIPVVGPWSLVSEVLASQTLRAASMVSTATVHARAQRQLRPRPAPPLTGCIY